MKNRHQVIPRTTCLVFNDQNQILLIEFSEEKGKMAGFFDPPGGHIEVGEGIVENATREIKEETGLIVENTKLRGIIHVSNFFGKNIMLHVMFSRTNETNLTESSEGKPQWVDLDKLDEIKIFKDLKLIINCVARQDGKSIFTAKSEFDDNGNMIKFEFEE